MTDFFGGDKVGVSSKADGFVGSYFSATVISELMNEGYVVQYMRLLKEDMSGRLNFETTGDEIAYPVSHLRVRQEYVDGNWVSSKNRNTRKVGTSELLDSPSLVPPSTIGTPRAKMLKFRYLSTDPLTKTTYK
ncbi:hypothetical protein RJ639_013933 [Escallonia herrerae]|uniref:Agenet-like domain-containing protein n=1 Tax=Escallonia herrerae TaxID=1293975 RepID=A0AA88VJP3_9ASTE|nr:hypothetical protein RJ639_013933 [Escallonia herrerae]